MRGRIHDSFFGVSNVLGCFRSAESNDKAVPGAILALENSWWNP